MNILELTKKQVLILSAVTVVVGIAAMASVFVYAAGQPTVDHNYTVDTPADTEINKQPVHQVEAENKANKPADEAQSNFTSIEPTKQAKPAQAAPAQPQAAKTEPGAHIPFTNKVVTPGDPASYIDTVGQCPFYEIVGPKGCYPPPNLVCNADWTVCDLIK